MPKAKKITQKPKPTCPRCGWRHVRKMKKAEFDAVKRPGILYRQVLGVEQYANLDPLICGHCDWVNFHGQLTAHAASGFYRDVHRLLS